MLLHRGRRPHPRGFRTCYEGERIDGLCLTLGGAPGIADESGFGQERGATPAPWLPRHRKGHRSGLVAADDGPGVGYPLVIHSCPLAVGTPVFYSTPDAHRKDSQLFGTIPDMRYCRELDWAGDCGAFQPARRHRALQSAVSE